MIALSAFLSLGCPAIAAAASLRYAAPGEGECPPGATLQEEVEHLLDARLADAPNVDVSVEITRAAQDDWRVAVSVRDRAHSEPRIRSISARSCAEAAETAAVAAAIAIRDRDPDPKPAHGAGPAAPAATSSVAATAVDARAVPPAPRAAEARSSTRFGLGASLLLDTGTLPGIAAGGVELEGLLDFSNVGLRARAFGGVLASQEERLPSGQGGKFDLVFAGLGACGVKALSAFSGLLCASLEAGALRGEGLVSSPRIGSSAWLAPRVDLGLNLPLLPGLSLSGRAGAGFPLIRQAFMIDGDQLVHRAASLTARFSAGLELSL